jgi:hypothetical protein
MSLQQLQQRLPEVRAWIDRTLLAHAARARPVADLGFTRLGSYYSTVLLTSAMVIPIAQVPVPPLAHMGLTDFGEFENLNAAGITYLSSFFVRLGYERDESLYFHELVHVVQWRHLGPEQFIIAYALGHLLSGGYRTNPLEIMAYDLQARFDRSGPAFDVASIVTPELDRIVPAIRQRAFTTGL